MLSPSLPWCRAGSRREWWQFGLAPWHEISTRGCKPPLSPSPHRLHSQPGWERRGQQNQALCEWAAWMRVCRGREGKQQAQHTAWVPPGLGPTAQGIGGSPHQHFASLPAPRTIPPQRTKGCRPRGSPADRATHGSGGQGVGWPRPTWVMGMQLSSTSGSRISSAQAAPGEKGNSTTTSWCQANPTLPVWVHANAALGNTPPRSCPPTTPQG